MGNIENTENKKIQLDDIARELGLSKSTVSRAISGKGRIGAETVKRVQEYIKIHDYHPNVIAKSLAESKTFNIGVVLPADSEVSDIPFFQRALMGICEAAAVLDYDVVVTTVAGSDISLLKRIISNNKVDGVVLTRSMVNDISVQYLKSQKFPLVLIGSNADDTLVQIDTDHQSACCELTSYIISKGCKAPALLIGSTEHMVNRARLSGYRNAFEKSGKHCDENLIYKDLSSRVSIERAARSALDNGADCIICSDDYICGRVLMKLSDMNIAIPDKVKVASFYNSSFLQSHNPPVTAIDIDVKELGALAAQKLIDLISGKTVKGKTLSNYEIVLKKSTS